MGCLKSKEDQNSIYPLPQEASALNHPMSEPKNIALQDVESQKDMLAEAPIPSLGSVKQLQKDTAKPAAKSDSSSTSSPISLKSLLTILNDIRANPPKYAQRIQSLYLDTQSATKPTSSAALTEAINFLKSNSKKYPPLKLDDCLTACAYSHSEFMYSKGEVDNNGIENKQFFERINGVGNFVVPFAVAESVLLSRSGFDAERLVLELVIDGEDEKRGQRKNVFTEKCHLVGLGVFKDPDSSQHFLTMDFASNNFKPNPAKLTPKIKEESGLNKFYKEK